MTEKNIPCQDLSEMYILNLLTLIKFSQKALAMYVNMLYNYIV